jgi:hypothetical protein|tara:strand:- start:92 stop:517 length:426 start_codon:yes stop_codon:yes gene_type:complete
MPKLPDLEEPQESYVEDGPTKRMYTTHVLMTASFPFTIPKPTREKSVVSAINTVCHALLSMRMVDIPEESRGRFLRWVRTEHPDVFAEASAHIGETREVHVPVGISLRRFRRDYATHHGFDGESVTWSRGGVEQTDSRRWS